MAKQPDGGEGTGRLDRAGIAHCGWHTPPWDKVQRDGLWFNIDQLESYAEAKRRIAGGSTKVEVKPILPVAQDKDPVPGELRDGDIVIEAGAYEGRWAKKVCEQRNCSIYAFEPATRAFEVAQEKLKGCQGVTLRNVALGKQNGTAVLCDRNRDGANTLAHNPESEPSETVPVVDVAEVVKPLGEIALAHFNAEGGEVDILERLVETGLIERFKMILVQWHQYSDELRARVAALTVCLRRTHNYEQGRAWGCWKRKDSAARSETTGRMKGNSCL
jgi:FkbM family methyltransferase